jgi:gas vesicle protein
MRDMYDDESANGLVLFVTGVFLGAAVALLLAPQSGRESREQIWGYGRRLRDRIGDTAEEMSGRTSEMMSKAGETFNKAIEKGRDYVQGEGLNKAVETGREFMQGEMPRSR